MTYPTGRIINYNRTTCACSVDSITTTYNSNTTTLMQDLTYRPFGGMSALDNGAGGTVGSTYNTSGRLTVSNPGATHERTYTYDNNGNLTSITSPSTPYYDRIYEYDSLNRLTSATAEDAWGAIDYTYDDVGNRLTEITDDNTYTYTYITGTNILDTVTDTETIDYTYDANGNITGIGNKVLSYNDDNRLVSVVQGGTTLGAYTYNGLGQRIEKVAGSTTTIFHYDFDGNIIGESDETGEFDKEYLYRGSSRLALVDVPNEEIYYYGNDQLGTPEILTDSTNTVVWEAIYKPFGEAEVNEHSSVVNNFRFSGQYFDAETGLHYNYHRYYDPSTGRYLTPDPVGLNTGINLFAYVGNNPVNETDPLGLLNILLGGGGSVVAPTGAEASVGVVINPGFGKDKADIGLVGSIGIGGGVNVSGDVYLGYVKGGIENVSGVTTNINIIAGPISLTIFTDPSTNKVIGGSVGWGPSATPIGASGTISATGTITLRDLIGYLKGLFTKNNMGQTYCECE